jgi:bifunctional DNA-binding transcriptional regulator/antitoxin component of YhaV-PrlF toxin-antitoxin module
METQQILKVNVKPAGSFGNEETFYAKMNTSGRITIPKLTLELLQEDDEESLVGSVLKVEIEPCEEVEEA